MPNFESILDKNIDDNTKPPPKPAGTYLAMVQGLPVQTTVGQDAHDVIDFKLKLIQPLGDDVDQEQLAALPPIQEWSAVRDRHFINTDQAQYYFGEFLKNVLGFSGMSGRQALAESPGKQYVVKMKQRPFVNQQGQPDIAFEVESRAHV